MCDADVHCLSGSQGRGPNKHREDLMLNFSCPALKYKLYLIRLLLVGPDLQYYCVRFFAILSY